MRYWDKAITLTTGCTKVSPACDNCWAETNHNRFMRKANKKYDHDFSEVRVHPENILLLKTTRKPSVFAVWNDAFHEAVDFAIISQLFTLARIFTRHTVLILTKRPERMAEYIQKFEEIPIPNVYLGTTVENQEQADKRIPELLKCIPFKLWLSVEPMLGEIDILKHMPICGEVTNYINPFSVVIAGCESGKKARETMTWWINDLRAQCWETKTPLWIKQIKIRGKMIYDHPQSTIKKEELWK